VRFLGIDLGEKRIGLAVSDADGKVAMPLRTLRRRSDAQAVTELKAIVLAEEIGALVIGEPRRLDGARSEAAGRAAAFAAKLQAATGLPCRLVDEALTSVAAAERLREAGVDPRRRPERLDAVAAQILLQDALDSPEGTR
jgi:putative Holliday junction resolvase